MFQNIKFAFLSKFYHFLGIFQNFTSLEHAAHILRTWTFIQKKPRQQWRGIPPSQKLLVVNRNLDVGAGLIPHYDAYAVIYTRKYFRLITESFYLFLITV